MRANIKAFDAYADALQVAMTKDTLLVVSRPSRLATPQVCYHCYHCHKRISQLFPKTLLQQHMQEYPRQRLSLQHVAEVLVESPAGSTCFVRNRHHTVLVTFKGEEPPVRIVGLVEPHLFQAMVQKMAGLP